MRVIWVVLVFSLGWVSGAAVLAAMFQHHFQVIELTVASGYQVKALVKKKDLEPLIKGAS